MCCGLQLVRVDREGAFPIALMLKRLFVRVSRVASAVLWRWRVALVVFGGLWGGLALVPAARAAASPAGSVLAWGVNTYGGLGDNSITDRHTPVQVTEADGTGWLSGVSAVAGGQYHSLALRSDGAVMSWGRGFGGELGDNSTTDSHIPVQVTGVGGTGTLAGVTAVAAGQYHSLALRSDGTVVAWGYNGSGELGDNSTTGSNTPVQVKGVSGSGVLSGVAAIATGFGHSLALRSDGTVVAWGANLSGELGDGTTTNRDVPVQVKGVGGSSALTRVVAVAAGEDYSLALLHDGIVVAWGDNANGQLGDNSTTNRHEPVEVAGVGGTGVLVAVAVAAGAHHSVALLSDGTVVAWGINSEGELGDGTTVDRHTPVVVHDVGSLGAGTRRRLSGVVAIAAGGNHNLALRSGGSVVAWGYNGNGELGDGTTTNRVTPVKVNGAGGSGTLSGVLSLAAGAYHSLAVQGASADLSPTALAFSGRVGSSSAPQAVTVTNSGPALLFISGDALSGSGAFTRGLDECQGQSLAAGATCTISFVFKPTSSGAAHATLSVQSNAVNGPLSAALSGTGVAVNMPLPPPSKPLLSALKLTPAVFRAASSGPTTLPASGKRGTLISYTDSQTATTSFLVQRALRGVLRGGRCIAPPRHPSRKAKRCTRYQTLARFNHKDTAGADRLRFTGRVKGRKLSAGSYRLQATASNANKTSAPRTAPFTIKP